MQDPVVARAHARASSRPSTRRHPGPGRLLGVPWRTPWGIGVNGARGPALDPGRCRRRRLLRQPGHLRDAPRGRARRRPGHARRPLPLRGRGHRRGRRLRHGWPAVRPRRCSTWDRASATAWPTCTTPAGPAPRSSTWSGDHATYARPLRRSPQVGHRLHRPARSRGGTARRPTPTTWRATRPTPSPPHSVPRAAWPPSSSPPTCRGPSRPPEACPPRPPAAPPPARRTPSTRWPGFASRRARRPPPGRLRAARRRPATPPAASPPRTGATLLGETFPANLERGAGIPAVERLAYLAEMVQAQLDGVRHLVLVDASAPVSFFAYPDKAERPGPAGLHACMRLAPRARTRPGARGACRRGGRPAQIAGRPAPRRARAADGRR